MAKEWARGFYNSEAWARCREAYIASVNGLCERCLKEGRIRPGKIVHHTVYLTPRNINDPNVSLNFSNLEYVCQECHNKEHTGSAVTREDVYFTEDGELVRKDSPPKIF